MRSDHGGSTVDEPVRCKVCGEVFPVWHVHHCDIDVLRAEDVRLREALTVIHDGLRSILDSAEEPSYGAVLSLESIARHALRDAAPGDQYAECVSGECGACASCLGPESGCDCATRCTCGQRRGGSLGEQLDAQAKRGRAIVEGWEASREATDG